MDLPLHLQVGLDTQYLLARMRTIGQTSEATQYEEQKLRTRGLHFLSIQVRKYLLRMPHLRSKI